MSDHLSAYRHYREQAEQWLESVRDAGSHEAGRDAVLTAQVYATLAHAAATAEMASNGLVTYEQNGPLQ